MKASNLLINMVHMLASKLLHTPLFIVMEWSLSGFQLAKIFHLVCRILEGKASLSSLTVAQATANIYVTDDPEEVAKRQAKFATKAIASFDVHTSDDGSRPHLITH